MKYYLLLITLGCFYFTTSSIAQAKADIIIFNALISTMDSRLPSAEAVAIQQNKIIAVGSTKDVMKWKSTATKLINAKGRRVIPGLFDSHLHVIRAGRFYNAELRWDGVKTLKRALEMLKEQALRTPVGQWVRVVGGWNEFQFEEKRLPTLEEINQATGNVPAFVLYLYGKAWVNKAGLQALAINSHTPNPTGGLIEKDEAGSPTGLLLAEPNALILYSTLARLPELSREEKINSTLQYMRELNRFGVTAVMDAGGGFQFFPDDYDITDSLHKTGQLTVRLPFFLFAQKKGNELNDFSNWIRIADIDHPQKNGINQVEYHVQGAGENLVADAADFENFLYPRPELPGSMEAQLDSLISLLVKNRWPFRLHATYNESISRDLDVIEKVNRQTPLNGLVWFLDHAETISEENMQRVKALGGGIAIQHRMAYQGEHFIRRYGSRLASQSPPVRRMLQLQIPVALGTDGTRVASYNPWIALYWITTGKSIGGVSLLANDQLLDRTTALQLMTSGGFTLIKDDLSKGRILPGFLADLVILDRDYFKIPASEIPAIKSLLTMLDGKPVYADSEYRALAPAAIPVIPEWSPVKFYGGYQDQ